MEEYGHLDSQNSLGFLNKISEHYTKAMDIGNNVKVKDVDKILVCGMGGSGIPGDLLKNLVGTEVNIETVKDYEIPEHNNEKTLVFAISYSGNTEETINMYRHARRLKCKTLLISSGGKLEEISKINNDHLIKIPGNIQPRMALPYLFFPVLNVLVNSGLVKDRKKEYPSLLKSLSNPKLQKMADDLSSKLLDKIILIYGSPDLSSVAYRWKTQFNENSKMFAFNNTFSELNHNELEAYNKNNDLLCIILSKDDDHVRIKKRIKLTKELLTKKRIENTQINMSGTSKLTKMFTSIFIGDYTSLLLAFKQNFDPSPVPVIEEFKKKL